MRREFHVRFCEGLGVRFPRATRLVILCRRESQAREALRRARDLLASLGLELHPDKTKVVELGIGQEGFDFLGCHFRIVRSHFLGRCYLFRWPSHRAMNAIRDRIRSLTGRRRWAGMRDVREVIAQLNPVLRGWCNSFRTGNASRHFVSLDRFLCSRLVRLIGQREGWKRRPFYAQDWLHNRFVHDFGLFQPRCCIGSSRSRASRSWRLTTRGFGKIQCNIGVNCAVRSATPGARMQREKTIGQPCAGNPHARLERGPQETERVRHRA